MDLQNFLQGLHHTSKLICMGTASIMGKTVEAAMVRNMYGQNIVWGMFSVDNRKGKFVGKLANNANTEGVVFHWPESIPVDPSSWNDVSPAEKKMTDHWRSHLMRDGNTVH